MKKKKSLLSLVLIALVLVLGVGYAVVSTQDLTISGSASTATSTLDVSFEGTANSAGAGTTIATAIKGDLTASIKVTGLTAIGETATATYTIQNKEIDLAALISKKEITNDKGEFFEVTTSVDKAEDAITIEPEGTGTVTVSVKLIKMPIETTDSTAQITVTLLATPVQPTQPAA